jgi:hypothetical protein
MTPKFKDSQNVLVQTPLTNPGYAEGVIIQAVLAQAANGLQAYLYNVSGPQQFFGQMGSLWVAESAIIAVTPVI